MSTTAAADAPANSTGRIVVASFVGTAIEFYDFYVYATATALVFAHLFFPSESPSAGQLLSFATFAIAFIALQRFLVGGLTAGAVKG